MPDRNPPSPKPPRKAAPTEIGDSSGIALNGVIVSRDYNAKMTGPSRIQIYDEMRLGDATVKATLRAIFLPILSARWDVEPISDKPRDKKVAEFVESELMDNGTRTWQETLTEILLYLAYGCMPFEIVFEWRGEQVGLRKLAARYPDTVLKWEVDGNPGIEQQTINGTFKIPIEKLIIFVNEKEGDNWEGISILRSAYKHWYTKDKLYLIDAISAERQGLGVPYAKSEGVTNPADESKIEEYLQSLRANEKGYLIAPKTWEIGFLDMKASTTKQLLPMIQHHDRQISKNVLAQFIELGATQTGSYALSADQSKLFVQSLESVARYISDMINRYLIKKLVDYNFQVDEYPTLTFDKIGTVDINALTTSLQRAAQMGFIKPDQRVEDYLRDVMDLPEYTGEESVDEHMADGMIMELENEMAELTGEGATDVAPDEDPNNPGFDMEGNPVEVQASWSDKEWIRAAEKLKVAIKGGAAGQPLSEETKRKISEALKRRGKGGSATKKKGKKAANPEITKRQKEVKALQKEMRDFSNSTRRELLQMKAEGKKLNEQERAKKELEIFEKKARISDKIGKLKDEISSIKEKEATPQSEKKDSKKASEFTDTLIRLNALIDANE